MEEKPQWLYVMLMASTCNKAWMSVKRDDGSITFLTVWWCSWDDLVLHIEQDGADEFRHGSQQHLEHWLGELGTSAHSPAWRRVE